MSTPSFGSSSIFSMFGSGGGGAPSTFSAFGTPSSEVNTVRAPVCARVQASAQTTSLSIIIDSLFTRKVGANVTFIGNDDSKHEFHRDMISQHSPFIQAMLETDEKMVEVPFTYDAKTLAIVRQYVYSSLSYQDLDHIDAWNVWRFAEQYNFHTLTRLMHNYLIRAVPKLPMETLKKLLIETEKVATNDTLKNAIINRYANHDKIFDARPCKISECKVPFKVCCKCKEISAGSKGSWPATITNCSKEFCCEHRAPTPDMEVTKKRSFDTFMEGIESFKPETRRKVIYIVRYNTPL